MIKDHPFVESLPDPIQAKLERIKQPDESIHIQVATDLDQDRTFTENWLVVTDRRVLLIPHHGTDGVVELPIADLAGVNTEGLVGGGRLELERKKGPPAYLYYSNTLAARFAEVAQAIRQLTQGEPVVLPKEVEPTRCPNCGRFLPEKGGLCAACVKKWETFRRIAGYLNPFRIKVVLLVLLSLSETLVGLVPPLITRHIIDDVLTPQANFILLVWFVLGLLGVRILNWALEVGRGWLRIWLGSHTTANIRIQLYRHLQYMPLKFYDKRTVGALISRITNDSDRLERLLIFGLPFVFTNGLMVIGILVLLFYMNWTLTLFVLLPVPPIVLGGYFMWDRLRRYWNRWSARWARLSSHLNESIGGIRVVKAFAQEPREGLRFDRHNDQLRQASVTAERGWFVFFVIINFFMSFGVFFVWYFGGRQILNQKMTLGVLMAFISYLWMLYRPLTWFGEINNWLTRAFAGAERVFEILDQKPELVQAVDPVPMPKVEGRVTFKNVHFAYDPAKPVLKDINLTVEPGEMIGLVGRSGVGKSTMINLICRFYDVDQGVIEIDGVDVRKIRLEDLRRHIGMVHQESFLFDGTIAENIAYGKPDATFDEIVRAAIAAHAQEFILTKPDGYDTRVGERGNKLSGGEKQRIAIARAILHDPKILILDEATSSLDTPTEKKIQQAIARLIKGRTTFAIAHRLSTLRSANRLVVLEEGKIAEIGTHQELLERRGIFYNLVQTQRDTSAVIAVGGGRKSAGQGG